MTAELRSLADLQPHERNPRTVTPEALAGLARSLGDFGDLSGIVWNARNGKLVCGHQRVKALGEDAGVFGHDGDYDIQTADGQAFPIRVVDWDEDKHLAAMVVANSQHIAGDWTPDLGGVLDDLAVSLEDFGELRLGELRLEVPEGEPVAGLTDADAVPEPPAEPVTQPGDLWTLGEHRLLCGDSTKAEDVERLMAGEQIQAVTFDPPYDAAPEIIAMRWQCADALVFTDARHLLDATDGWPKFRSVFTWDCVTSWFTPGYPLARSKHCLWFGDSEYNPDGSHYGEADKPHRVTNTRGSYDYVPDPAGKHLSTIFPSPITQEFAGHAHAKPVAWLRLLLANCTGGLVLDPFLGSGTTIIAAEQLGRRCYGIEIEPRYCDVAVSRWEQFTGKKATRQCNTAR